MDLLEEKKNVFSQNGEDGIIEEILRQIGPGGGICCEFGAWDGIHLSNCRRLILDGWRALMIEGDAARYQDLVSTYRDNPSVICVNRFVDDKANSLGSILKEHGIDELDFLSVDIDGYDYEILKSLDVRPRIICIEVNAGHSPYSEQRIEPDIAKDNVGQPLPLFVRTADEMGYRLVCYTGNAFFVRDDMMKGTSLKELTCEEVYSGFLDHLSLPEKEWLYLVNLGVVPPYYRFANAQLGRGHLGIPFLRALRMRCAAGGRKAVRDVRNIMTAGTAL